MQLTTAHIARAESRQCDHNDTSLCGLALDRSPSVQCGRRSPVRESQALITTCIRRHSRNDQGVFVSETRLHFAAALVLVCVITLFGPPVLAQTLFWDAGSWDANIWAGPAGVVTAEDRDGDGVPNIDDGFPDSDSASLDLDGDGKPDTWNPECGPDCQTTSELTLDNDDDNDGIADDADACFNTAAGAEVNVVGCALNQVDTDGDGVNDADEQVAGTDPTKADTDGDGLSDKEEIEGPTNPLAADTDGDGWSDKEEFESGSDPVDANDEPILQGLNIILIYQAVQPQQKN